MLFITLGQVFQTTIELLTITESMRFEAADRVATTEYANRIATLPKRVRNDPQERTESVLCKPRALAKQALAPGVIQTGNARNVAE